MKILVVLLGLAAATASGLAQDTLSKQLTPEEYARAGLGKLSPQEISELDALFGKYRKGDVPKPVAVAPAPKAPAPKATPPPAPAPTPKASPPPPEPATPAAPVVAENQETGQGFIRLRKAAPPPKRDIVVISTEVDGTFTGWEETTVWTMKDGSIWRVDNRPRPYFSAKVSNPKVRITPALLNGYWIDFVDLGVRVRAVRLK